MVIIITKFIKIFMLMLLLALATIIKCIIILFIFFMVLSMVLSMILSMIQFMVVVLELLIFFFQDYASHFFKVYIFSPPFFSLNYIYFLTLTQYNILILLKAFIFVFTIFKNISVHVIQFVFLYVLSNHFNNISTNPYHICDKLNKKIIYVVEIYYVLHLTIDRCLYCPCFLWPFVVLVSNYFF